jgi:hypothetical protein
MLFRSVFRAAFVHTEGFGIVKGGELGSLAPPSSDAIAAEANADERECD